MMLTCDRRENGDHECEGNDQDWTSPVVYQSEEEGTAFVRCIVLNNPVFLRIPGAFCQTDVPPLVAGHHP